MEQKVVPSLMVRVPVPSAKSRPTRRVPADNSTPPVKLFEWLRVTPLAETVASRDTVNRLAPLISPLKVAEPPAAVLAVRLLFRRIGPLRVVAAVPLFRTVRRPVPPAATVMALAIATLPLVNVAAELPEMAPSVTGPVPSALALPQPSVPALIVTQPG